MLITNIFSLVDRNWLKKILLAFFITILLTALELAIFVVNTIITKKVIKKKDIFIYSIY